MTNRPGILIGEKSIALLALRFAAMISAPLTFRRLQRQLFCFFLLGGRDLFVYLFNYSFYISCNSFPLSLFSSVTVARPSSGHTGLEVSKHLCESGRARGEGGSEGGAAMMDFHAGPSADERAINSLLSEGRPLRPRRAGGQASRRRWRPGP